MTGFLAQIIAWVNVPINALSRLLLPWIGEVPGWVSNTAISAVTGVVLLVIFKYTSNQRAIGRVRDDIKANMLALKLYKDSISITLRVQGRIFAGAGMLLFHGIRPMLVIIVPVSLLLGQMGLWYQSRPLAIGEETLISMQLNGTGNSPLPEVSLESTPGAEVVIGSVRDFSTRQIYWKIRASDNGCHHLVFVFKLGRQQFEKQLAVGTGFMRVSTRRPGWHWTDILLHPAEKPFARNSVVQSISIDYPPSKSFWTVPLWVIYFLAASTVFALAFKPFLKVRI